MPSQLEPGIAPVVRRLQRQETGTDWGAYRQCPACMAATGHACRALSGRLAGREYPSDTLVALDRAHGARKLRTRR